MITEEMYCRRLISMIYDSKDAVDTYQNLFMHLYSCDFEWPRTVPGDANRCDDGLQLRRDLGFGDALSDKPCSILEMLISLARRMENDIMHNPELGDRTGQWFWTMIVNLGLGSQNDRNYDPAYINSCIDIFIRRQYGADGSNGGLFVVNNPRRDLRDVDIWYQAMWYLSEIGN